MEALILDQNYDSLAVLDTFKSFIWTERYCGYGDFELYLPAETNALKYLQINNYVMRRGSSCLMIIEQLEISSAEDGIFLIVSGRSLESILDRRIIWGSLMLSGSFQDRLFDALRQNVMSGTDRAIPKFTLKKTEDPIIVNASINVQLYGDNLYDVIYENCASRDFGFRILPLENGGLEFEFYAGKDRSYRQETLPWVIFSPNFDNLRSSTYLESLKEYKNVAFVAGDGDGSDRKSTSIGSGTGLSRRELYVDASGISSSIDGEEIPSDIYIKQLQGKGSEALIDAKITKIFEGDIDAHRQFVYAKDFFIGDIVQVINEYGKEGYSRITELVISDDGTGESIIPTFISVEGG